MFLLGQSQDWAAAYDEKIEEGVKQVVLDSLEPGTTYTCRLLVAGEDGALQPLKETYIDTQRTCITHCLDCKMLRLSCNADRASPPLLGCLCSHQLYSKANVLLCYRLNVYVSDECAVRRRIKAVCINCQQNNEIKIQRT